MTEGTYHRPEVAPRWQPGPQVASRRLDDEVVLVNLRTNRIFSLNRTGARFWELLETGHDWADVRAALLEEFDVEQQELDRQLEALAESLAAEGFVQEDAIRPEVRAAIDRRRRFPARTPRRTNSVSLLIRMGVWSLVLPALKHLLPLPKLVRVMSRHKSGARSADAEKEIVRSARRVYRLRRPGTCLERSLLAYRYLSAANADPRLVVGVRRGDGGVLGHAWVVVDDSPLYESRDGLALYAPVVEFAADGRTTATPEGRPASLRALPRL